MRTGFDPAAVEAVLCDADGCLFPSEEPAFAASAEVTEEFLAELGVETAIDAEALRLATTGRNFRTTATALAAEHGAQAAPERLELWIAEERRRVSHHLGRVLRPDPRVLGPLLGIAEGFSLALVSSSALARIEVCLAATGLGFLFPVAARFSAEDSLPRPTSKPDPAIYRLAGERLGVAGAQGLAVEDSRPGAEAAIVAGFPTIGNLTFVPPAERQERAAELAAAGVVGMIESWIELEQLLNRRRAREDRVGQPRAETAR
jgi:beta-phosphoglucomutase-like phosphatase (HAD superfamily)